MEYELSRDAPAEAILNGAHAGVYASIPCNPLICKPKFRPVTLPRAIPGFPSIEVCLKRYPGIRSARPCFPDDAHTPLASIHSSSSSAWTDGDILNIPPRLCSQPLASSEILIILGYMIVRAFARATINYLDDRI
jgi:hypothetical protein